MEPHTDTAIQQIEKVQRRAARWVKRDYSRSSSVTAMQQSLNWRRLDLHRIDIRLSIMCKITHGLVAIPRDQYLTALQRQSRTSHPMAYRQIAISTDYIKYSFFPCTIVHWNSLPPEVVSLPNVDDFNWAVSQINHVSPGRVWNQQTGTPWPRPGTMTKISILDCKTNMYLTLFILGLYYEVLNIHYPTKRNFRSDLLLFFKLRFIVSRGMKPTDNPFSFLKIIL